MRKRFAIVCVVVIGTIPVSVATASVLDQSQPVSGGSATIYSGQSIAQTFVPGMTGRLERVEVELAYGTTTYPLNVSIVETVSGAPTGTVLGLQPVSGTLVAWKAVDFLSDEIDLVAGQEYAIILECDEPTVSLGSGWKVVWDGNLYPAGTLWDYAPSEGSWAQKDWSSETEYDADAVFRTYMIPEPATLGLLALGGLALVSRRRK